MSIAHVVTEVSRPVDASSQLRGFRSCVRLAHASWEGTNLWTGVEDAVANTNLQEA